MPEPSKWEVESPGTFFARPLGIVEILRFFSSNILLIIGGPVLGLLLGLAAQQVIPRAYEARGKFVVDELPFNQSSGGIDAETERQLVQTLILSIPSKDMKLALEKRLNLSPGQIAFSDLDLPLKLKGSIPEANITVTAVRNSRLGMIEATSQSPEFASDVVNGILEEMQLFNLLGGKLKNVRLNMELAKVKADSVLKQLVEVTSQRIKLEQENASLNVSIKEGLPLQSFPTFATDITLNNLKTQLILVESEYNRVASTSTRGERLVGKRAELESLKTQIASHVQRLVGALRSQFEIIQTQESNLQSDLKAAKDQVDSLGQLSATLSQSFGDPAAMQALSNLPGEGPTGPANIIVIADRATPITKPIRPKLWLNLFLGVSFGGACGLALALLRSALDNRIKSASQIERETGQPCIATLPKRPSLTQRTSQRSVFDHPDFPIGLVLLRSHLLHKESENPDQKIIGFVPVGATQCTLVADLAILLAQAEKKTLVVDLNLNSPGIAKILGIKVAKSLDEWMTSSDPLSSYVNYSAVRELAVLSAGSSHSDLSDMLSRRPLSDALLELAKSWDFILIDSPSILSDWSLILTLPPASPILISAEYRRSTTDEILQTVQHARGPGWKVEGVVLLGAPDHRK